ncbi:MAG TPA: hypothetical protein DIW17_17925 [Clostridiales bacterium]|nr:hypothetical protein [Clostridiales bacterium]
MRKSSLKVLYRLADETQLSLDESSGAIYGNKSGYNVYITMLPGIKTFNITLSVMQRGKMPTYSEMKKIIKTNRKFLIRCDVVHYKVEFCTAPGYGPGLKGSIKKAIQALEIIISELKKRNFENACEICGTAEDIGCFSANTLPMLMCDTCFEDYCETYEIKRFANNRKVENIIGGVTGTILGALPGVLCIVLLGQLGLIASVSGLVMGVCTLKGYEMLGNKLSIKGIIISILLMIVMVYMGQRIDYAVRVAKVFEVDFITGFHALPYFIAEDRIKAFIYYGNLCLLYLFTALGAGTVVHTSFRNFKIMSRTIHTNRLVLPSDSQ